MPRVNVYIQNKNWLAWLQFKNKSAFVNQAIENQTAKKSSET